MHRLVIIGAETGRRKNKTVPEWEWVRKIVLEAGKNGVPVFMKESLVPVAGEENMCRECFSGFCDGSGLESSTILKTQKNKDSINEEG